MKANELLNSHRYVEAIAAFKKEMRNEPNMTFDAGIGQAYLALGEYEKGLEYFRRDNEIESGRLKGSFPSLLKIGTVLWLMGKQREAMSEWHRAAAGVLDGSIRYGDLAGGGTQGLLLWYSGITLKDNRECQYALEYLRGRTSKKATGICWPRPVILMALGEKSFADVLKTGSGSSELSACLEKSRIDLLARRRLCQTLFYAACQKRQIGNEAECIETMRLCSRLENPIIESEWYLAREESRGKEKVGKEKVSGT